MLQVVTNLPPLTPPLTPDSLQWPSAFNKLAISSPISTPLPPIRNLFAGELKTQVPQTPISPDPLPSVFDAAPIPDEESDPYNIPTHYFLDKLSILGQKFFNDASTADLTISVVTKEPSTLTHPDPTSPQPPTKYTLHSSYPAHTPFLTARSPRLRALIFACDAAAATHLRPSPLPSSNPLKSLPTTRSKPSSKLKPYTRYIGRPTRRKLPLHPPSPETFGMVLRWMYTEDVHALEGWFEEIGKR
ncbi:hypothetical protein HK097_003749, partial [Rhizophlyctis rosea]